MVRLVGLIHHISRTRSPACPARGLGEKGKGLLPAAVIRSVKRQICGKGPHQSDLGEVMSLYNHLGADEDICLPPGEGA